METAFSLPGLLASLYDGNPDAIAVFDRGGHLVSCNRSALLLSGYADLQDIAGAHSAGNLFAHDDERIHEALESALAGYDDHFEATLYAHDGGLVHAEVYVFPARHDDEIKGVFLQLRDTIALRQAEQSLTLSQQQFRSLFEYYPDPIAALTLDGNISRVNVALESLTGYYGEQVIGKPWTDLVAPECRREAEEEFREALRGEAVELDTFLLNRLGNRIDVQMKLVPLRIGEDAQGAYMIAKDVAVQRGAERAIAIQGERIRQLYLAAAARGDSVDAQIDNTLALGCRLFGFDYGYVTRFEGDSLHIVNAVGDGAGVPRGAVYRREASLSRHIAGDRQTLFVSDLDEEPWRDDPARHTAPWRSYYATKLSVNNTEFGALVFASRRPHGAIPDMDRDLIQLMSLFVAGAIERARYAERIQQLAFYDSLTGLPNRVLFDDRIKQTIGAAKRYNRGFAVMYLDLDDFKGVNDRFGHPAGDRVLKAVADRLTLVLRESDTVARFGGDEFAILQPVVNGAADAADLARKIVETLQQPLEVEGNDHLVHTSIGIALYPADGGTPEDLMEHADHALYNAKGEGRNRWTFYNSAAALKKWPRPK
jgi:diguanylate cyclase (GGDEF)-like protein/PAS domain S-box-containing protein